MKNTHSYSLHQILLLGIIGLFISLNSCASKQGIERKVLVFTKTKGWKHESIPSGVQALVELGALGGFMVDTSKNAALFTDKTLKEYDAVVFLSTTGDVLNAEQQAAFERYIQAGGGFVGIHSAACTEYDWPWFGKLMGAHFANHPHNPGVRQATVRVNDKTHSATAALPDAWVRDDEWYNYKAFYPGIRVLASLDETTYTGGTHGSDHPIAWYHAFDGGRSFYTGGGHTHESYSEPLFREHLLGGILYAMGEGTRNYAKAVARVTPEENRFVKKILVDDLNSPMELAISADGRVFFTELTTGKLLVYDTKRGRHRLVHQFEVETRGGTGLMGISLDPDFLRNHFLYVYYAPAGAAKDIHFNLSRFTLNPDLGLDEGSEKILLKVNVSENSGSHHGGSLAWDGDGNLYLSTGGSTSPFASNGYAPLDERPGEEFYSLDEQRSSSNTNDLKGKILRIHPEPDGTYSIPEGNLFPPGTAKTRPEIYVMGCRNPFRITVNPNTATLYWGDIGPDAGKDSIQGPRGYDEINQTKQAGNWGWPYFIADNQAYTKWDFASQSAGPKFDPQAPVNNSPNNTGLGQLPPAQPAMIWYPYAASDTFPEFGQGGRSVMVGEFYHHHSSTASEKAFPEYYHGSLFVFDWMRNWLMALRFDEAENYQKAEPIMSLNGDFRRPIDLAFNNDGIMYMLEYGSVYGVDNEDARLVQIEYNRGNRTPMARAAVLDPVAEAKLHKSVFLTSELRTLPLEKTIAGSLPLQVSFTSRGSADPDTDDVLTYEWQLEGNGVSATVSDPVHTYTKAGIYKAVLTLTDQHGLVGSDTVTVMAGNAPPLVEIATAANQSFFWPDQPYHYRINVKDGEETIRQEDVEVYFDYAPEAGVRAPDRTDAAGEALPLGAALMAGSDCKACHTLSQKSVGPSYTAIAQHYKGKAGAQTLLTNKIIAGGSGTWGSSMMSAHPQLSVEDVNDMVNYIFSLAEKPTKAAAALQGTLQFEQHKKEEERGAYTLRASYTDGGANGVGPQKENAIIHLRPARQRTAYADAHIGFERYRNSLGSGSNADYLLFRNIDLSGIRKFVYELSAQTSGAIVVRIDSRAGPVIAKTTFKETGDWDKLVWLDAPLEKAVSGFHDVYFIVEKPEKPNENFLNFQYISFSR